MAEPQVDPNAPKFDPETATLEQLRAEAEKVLAADPELPRDEKGRFVARDKSEDTPPASDKQDDTPVVFRREIDLGDGSGVQVFEAESLEALVDKLATAQTHATRKIRELSTKKSETPAAPEKPKPPFTEDEEWVLGQELLTKPSEAFNKMFERIVGKQLSAFKSDMERLNALEQAQSADQASSEFIQKHPEYVATGHNGELIVGYLETYKLPATLENLETAFQKLSSRGLLETEKSEAPGADDGTKNADASRIANPADEEPPKRRAASGLSARRSAPATKSLEPTEEELNSMPMDKLRELATRSLLDSNG